MSTYAPQEGVYPGRPPCANCGANFQLHRAPVAATAGLPGRAMVTGRGLAKLYDAGVQLECPEAYRPGTLELARRALEEAEASGDANRIFTARGDLQRLEGRRRIDGGDVVTPEAAALVRRTRRALERS